MLVLKTGIIVAPEALLHGRIKTVEDMRRTEEMTTDGEDARDVY
jgi:hypothetical protein